MKDKETCFSPAIKKKRSTMEALRQCIYANDNLQSHFLFQIFINGIQEFLGI
jgi:hypothetical protein